MATKKTEAQAAATTAVAVQQNTAVAVSTNMFEQDAGHGMEGATQESFAIPFLTVLQKGSPQVDEASGAAIEGAKAGMLFDNVTGAMVDGKKGVVIVPCAYRRVFVRWGAKDAGGGFKGEMTPEEVAHMREAGQIVELDGKLLIKDADGSVNEKKSDVVKDTRNHYVLIVDEVTGAYREALLSLSSTQIKKSKMLMSALAAVKVQGSAGMFTPPTYANKVRVTTLPESNDKGTWYGVKFEMAGHVNAQDMYTAAKAFHASVSKGGVVAKYEDAETSAAPAAEGF